MQKYQNSISNTLTGIPVQGATVRVQAWPAATDVTLYSSNNLATPLPSNILTTAVDGSFSFYAPNGRYQFVVTPPGAAPSTLTDIALFDLADYAFSPSAPQFTSTVATGTPPFVVNSTTKVANLVAGGNLGRTSLAFTIGAQNCDYTTIQSALTANPTANALFLVYPGTYTNDTINFTASGQCVIGMGAGEQQVVTAASANMCAIGSFTNCFVRNMTINITAATSAVSAITCVAGNAEFDECYFNVTNSTVATAAQPSIASISGAGRIDFDGGDFNYTNNVTDGTGVTAIKAAFLPGAGNVNFSFATLSMAGAGQSLAMTVAYTASTGYATYNRSDITVTDLATSQVVGYYSAGSGVLANIQLTTFVLTGGAATSVIGIWLTGSATLSTDYCSVDCLGGLANYSGNIGAGCTWNSSFDDFVAANGYVGAGTFNYASSPAPGQFKVTSNVITPSLNGGYLGGYRNRIINSGFAVSQVNGSNAVTVTAGAALNYVIDQFYAYCTGANVTGQRVAGTLQDQYKYQFTGAASVTAIGFAQRMESLRTYSLNGTTATFSVELKNSLLTTCTWTAYYANTTDTFGPLAALTRTQIATGTFTMSATETVFSAQIAIPSAATTGIEIVLTVGAQTSGTWTIGEMQLEPGPVATTFEEVNYDDQLRWCQRYLPVFNSGGTTSSIGSAFASTTNAYTTVVLPVPTRIPVTGVVNSGTTIFSFVGIAGSFISTSGMSILYAQSNTSVLTAMAIATVGAGHEPGSMIFNTASGQFYFTGAQL